jgi:hypothetical protein
VTLSEYGFDFDNGEDAGLGESEQAKGPKWFREGLEKLSSQNKELRDKIHAMEAEKAKAGMSDTLKAAGVDPGAAALYQGEPDKVDDWLNANKAWLKPLETSGEPQQEEQEQAPQGPPASTVPAEGQEQMQRMQAAGAQGVAPPQGSDKETAAAIAALNSPEDLANFMRSQGNPFDWSS